MSNNTTKPKKTIYDYIKPHDHRPISNALDTAKNDYYNERIKVIAQVAYKHGANASEISRALGLDLNLVRREYPKLQEETNDK